jgi:hypothetical protein
LSGPIQPYFCERVAIARKTVGTSFLFILTSAIWSELGADLELIQFIEEEAGRGFYERAYTYHLLRT